MGPKDEQVILIATPCYGGMVTEPHFRSCLALREALLVGGIGHDWYTLSNESLVQRARNTIVKRFLETNYKKLLFIDSDIEFSPEDVAKLWNMDVELCVGVYPMKKPGAGYAAWVNGELVKDLDYNEPIEVDYAGTGFMMIDRNLLEDMKEAYPERKHEDGAGWSFAWFDPRVEDEIYLSEDYAFCKDVREMGGKILMDPSIRLIHHGTYGYGS